jgi:molecular chaperone DnaJ
MSVTACDTCSGTGEVIADSCDTCGGQGVHVADRTVKVEIPAGVDSGTRLRLTSEGEAAPRGGQSGDLYVEVGVRPDPRFERAAEDLVHRASVGMADAALGTRIEVPLVDGGNDMVDVPAGTQPGWVHRIPGRGMGRLGRRGRGDLLVHVSVRVPTDLSKEQEELLHAFLEASGGEPSSTRKRRRGR